MSTDSQKLSFLEKTGYGCGDFASVLFWQTIMVYLLFFYTDVFGLAAAAAGTMIAISRALDAFFDVGIGMTADRTQTRWGKFRPYLIWMSLPLAIAAVLAFSTPGFSPTGKLVYAYVTFIAFMFFYSAINIPYTSLLGVISGEPNERTSASSFKFVGAYSAGIVVSATALPLAEYFGGGNSAKGWQTTMVLYAIVAIIFFTIVFFSTHERIQPMSKEKTSVRGDLKDISKNTPWIVLFGVTILLILFVAIRLNATVYYFKYYVSEQVVPWMTHFINFMVRYVINPLWGFFGKQPISLVDESHKYGYEVLASFFNVVGQGSSLLGVLLVPWFSRVFGRKNAAIALFVAALISTGLFFVLGPADLLWMFILQIVGSVVGGPISPLLWAMYADTADYSEWKTGRRATGLVYSASIMSNKLGWAISTAIAGWILAMTGFQANVAQNVEVLSGIKSMMSVIPVVPGLVAVLLLIFFYGLNEPVVKKIKEEVEARRAAAGVAEAR
ncbi:MAG TPA: MFS transporter [Candidatus Acidoferrales bacterium]|nr:MFS transporter [Candidatus Acidoferrales bacterium]